MMCLRSLLLILPLLTLIPSVSANLCNLCDGGVAGLHQPNHFIDAHGTTCVTKALELAADYREGSNTCNAEISRYRRCCCSSTPQCSSITQVAAAAPVYNGPSGTYPECDICKGRGYISNPAMVINMLYIGTASCKQMYDYAMAGLIQRHMCDPLQHYAYEPCGCGEYGNGQAQQAPVYNVNVNHGAGSSAGGSNNSGNNGGSSNGGSSNGISAIRKQPVAGLDKNNIKYGRQGRGGSANGGRRQLKGSKV